MTPGIQDTFDNIVRGHRIVRESVRALMRTSDPAELREQLQLLAGVLPEHFAYEESEHGYFAHLREHLDPRRHAAIDRLIFEHRQMSSELAALLEDASSDEWVSRAKRFAQLLKAHEQTEARLGVTAGNGY